MSRDLRLRSTPSGASTILPSSSGAPRPLLDNEAALRERLRKTGADVTKTRHGDGKNQWEIEKGRGWEEGDPLTGEAVASRLYIKSVIGTSESLEFLKSCLTVAEVYNSSYSFIC